MIVTIGVASVILIAIIGFLIAVSSMFRDVGEARTALTLYSDALIAGDYHKAYSLRSSEYQSAVPESKFDEQERRAVFRFGRLKRVVLRPGKRFGNLNGLTISIDAQVIYERTEFLAHVRMKKDGDRWLLLDYSASGE
jgi:hypothetical protein